MTQLILIFSGVFGFTVFIFSYKSLSKLRSMSEQHWGSVQSHLFRKYDLITLLTDYLKDHSEEYKDTADKVQEAKLKAMQAFSPMQKSFSEKSLDENINKVFEISQENINLTNDKKFKKIKEDIESVRKELFMSSSYYNAIIRDYNSKIGSFPSSVVARILGHYNKETFDIDLSMPSTRRLR